MLAGSTDFASITTIFLLDFEIVQVVIFCVFHFIRGFNTSVIITELLHALF